MSTFSEYKRLTELHTERRTHVQTKISGGLWTPKLTGVIEEGDSSTTRFFIEGTIEIKELSGHLKMFFRGIKMTERKFVITDEDKRALVLEQAAILLEATKADMKEREIDFDEEDETELMTKKRMEEAENLAAAIIREKKTVVYPKLNIFLSKKRPKKRMTDVHKTGAKVYIHSNTDGLFTGADEAFEAGLKDIPDVLGYSGIVILKLPSDEPKTEEPVIYGLVKLQSAKSQKIRTLGALHLTEVMDELARILDRSTIPTEPPEADGPTNGKKKKKKALAPPPVKKTRKASDILKGTSYYRTLTNNGWAALNKTQDEQIDFPTFLKMIDSLNIFMVDAQAKRLFDAVDVGKAGVIDMLAFENFLMSYDVLGTETDLTIIDIFDSFKVEPTEDFKEFFGNKQGLDFSGFCEAVQLLGVTKSAVQKAKALQEEQLAMTKMNTSSEPGSTPVVDGEEEEDEQKEKEEADEETRMLEAFCFATGCKKLNAHEKFMSLEELKKGWLKLANVEEELIKRNLKYDKVALSEGRNRERLNRWVTDQEKQYFIALGKVVETCETVKRDRRMRKEEKKKEQAAFREKLLHEAQKFIAIRNQEKRIQQKLAEEEKNRKRLEEKALRIKLLEKQNEAKATQESAIQALMQQSESLRIQEIKNKGWDRIDHSMKRLRYIPPVQYETSDARNLLSFAVIIDYSRNVLDHLPDSNFLFFMQAVKKLSFAQNRLKTIPNELCDCRSLQALELETNKLLYLPGDIGNLTSLARLDISNNKMETLPDSIGFLGSLRFLSAHSNQINYLPQSMGALFRLEYLDLNGNMLVELPEDFRYMASLVYVNLSNNRIGHLPHYFGHCNKMVFLDVSRNDLASLPDTFSELENLEVCCLEGNQIIIRKDTFNMLSNLKKLTMHYNQIKNMFSDIGGCTNVTYFDASVNSIVELPPETGLMASLQELKLNYNDLTSLPPELGSCTNLQRLEVSHNKIEGSLPETIGLFETLTVLNFSFNLVTEIPRSVIGLKQINEIYAERCKLTSLPDTFITLQTLTVLEIPNNDFVRFPIELAELTNLKILNLNNNRVELLPRNINNMTQLSTLNLGRNGLRAIPTEFTDILETVPHVDISENPWSDWPNKWGKLFDKKQCSDSILGYSIPDVLHFLYSMQLFYYDAEKLWNARGAFYYKQKLNFHDYCEDLRRMMPPEKYQELSMEHVKIMFFTCRERGLFPRWYSLDADTKHAIALRTHADMELREEHVRRTRADVQQRYEDEHMAYDVDIKRRANRAKEMADEYHINQAIMTTASNIALKDLLIKKERVTNARRAYKDDGLYEKECAEMRRLQGIMEDESRIRQRYDADIRY